MNGNPAILEKDSVKNFNEIISSEHSPFAKRLASMEVGIARLQVECNCLAMVDTLDGYVSEVSKSSELLLPKTSSKIKL